MYVVDGKETKRNIIKENIGAPTSESGQLLANIGKHTSSLVGSQ